MSIRLDKEAYISHASGVLSTRADLDLLRLDEPTITCQRMLPIKTHLKHDKETSKATLLAVNTRARLGSPVFTPRFLSWTCILLCLPSWLSFES